MEIERIKGSKAIKEIGYPGNNDVKEDNFYVKVIAGPHILYFRESEMPEGEKVWIVQKNADFTEGRGPMHLDRIFWEIEDAIDYVLGKEGIYGSKQGLSNHCGINIYGCPYAYTRFNGYEIKPMAVF